MKKIMFAVFSAVVLAGCVTVGNQKLDDVGSYLALKEHVSTKSDVYGMFGQPHDVRLGTGADRIWVYYKVHTRPSAWSYVPYVGLLAGGSARTTTFAYFLFDGNGVFQKVEAKSDSDYENSWAGLGRAISHASDRTQSDRVREEMLVIGKPFDEKIAKRVAAIRDK